jgi:gamma-glutamyltranspeptidase/glutathione hydrolase
MTSPAREGDTCHLDVIDRWGNVVAATPSGGWLTSSPVVPGLGFPLGTRGQMFWLQTGLASSLRPKARPRTTLTPSIALGPSSERMAFGTPGGDSQDQWCLQFFVNVVDRGMDLQAAIDAPFFQTNHAPDSFFPRRAEPLRVLIEDRVPAAARDELTRRGHHVVPAGAWTLGRNCAAMRDGDGTRVRAAASARHQQAYAVGR